MSANFSLKFLSAYILHSSAVIVVPASLYGWYWCVRHTWDKVVPWSQLLQIFSIVLAHVLLFLSSPIIQRAKEVLFLLLTSAEQPSYKCLTNMSLCATAILCVLCVIFCNVILANGVNCSQSSFLKEMEVKVWRKIETIALYFLHSTLESSCFASFGIFIFF